MSTSKKNIEKFFEQKYNTSAEIVAVSPGRINIIGEHTDYNDGFVLPAAIDQCTIVAVSKRNDDVISLSSVLYNEELQFGITDIKPQKDSWSTYILGVVNQLIERGYKINGFNLVVDGDVPLGAGLSSSASVECATAIALNKLFDLNIAKDEIIKIAQKAEHTYAGVMCGIMDQFASVFSKENQVTRLDCRDLTYQYFPLELGDYTLLLLNTNVKHSLASSAYNERRQACEKSVEIIKEKHPEVRALRDVTISMLEDLILENHADLFPKAKYIVEENQRVNLACHAMQMGDLKSLGALMYATHEGLHTEFEVSCAELDFLVDFTKDLPEVLGARMMGGGFGGCTINLVKKSFVDELIEKIKPAYEQKFNLQLTNIEVVPSNGGYIL